MGAELFVLRMTPFFINHAIENEGIKSEKGKISSMKFNTPPILPILPPKVFRNMKAETGAQITSDISPRAGIEKLTKPMRSIIMQKVRLGAESF